MNQGSNENEFEVNAGETVSIAVKAIGVGPLVTASGPAGISQSHPDLSTCVFTFTAQGAPGSVETVLLDCQFPSPPAAGATLGRYEISVDGLTPPPVNQSPVATGPTSRARNLLFIIK